MVIILKTDEGDIPISKNVFNILFDNNIGNEDDIFIQTNIDSSISYSNLKKISYRYQIPYPLFFCNDTIVNIHVKSFEERVLNKFPTKDEIFFNSRSSVLFQPLKVSLIVRDIARKQLFLKKILSPAKNKFINFLWSSKTLSLTDQANTVRSYFNIDINEIKSLPNKNSALEYLITKIENKNILISTSSYNYMPQRIDPKLDFSGFCIKDNYYPWIFLNNKDDQEKPSILEPDGRKILTIIYLLCQIARNHFFTVNSRNERKSTYDLALEVLIPKSQFKKLDSPVDMEILKTYSKDFKVTPSFILEILKKRNMITQKVYDLLKMKIIQERKGIKNGFSKTYSHVNRYAKYNGKEFSRKIVKQYDKRKISSTEAKSILFKDRKVKNLIFSEYCSTFRV